MAVQLNRAQPDPVREQKAPPHRVSCTLPWALDVCDCLEGTALVT